MSNRIRSFVLVAGAILGLAAGVARAQEPTLSPERVRTVTEEAAVFGFPLVQNYGLLHHIGVDTTSALHAPLNTFRSASLVPELENSLMGTFDSGTQFALAILDLRQGPVVITVPAVSERYYSLQLVDMLTDNFAYVSTRATGTKTGSYVVVGPGWKGYRPFPGEVSQTVPAPSWIVLLIGRMELRGGDDPGNAWKDFRVRSLQEYYGKPAPPSAPLAWPPDTDGKTDAPADFFTTLNFMMQWQVFLPSEASFLHTLSTIGVVPGKPFSTAGLDAARRQAMEEGLEAARDRIRAASDSVFVMNRNWGTLPRDLGNIEGDYLLRAALSWRLLYVNGPQETLYFAADADSTGAPLDGSTGSYGMVFTDPPPTRFFWSLTVLDRKSRDLEEGSIREFVFGKKGNVFSLNIRDTLKKDGPLRVVLQQEDPGNIENTEWLRIPDGPFVLVLRVFGPAPGGYTRGYAPPAIVPRSGAGAG